MKQIAQNIIKEIVEELQQCVSNRSLANEYQCLLGVINIKKKKHADDIVKNKVGRKSKFSNTIKRGVILSIRSREVNIAIQVKNRLKALNNIDISVRVYRVLR